MKGFEQNKVGRRLKAYHDMKCEERGRALLPPFLLQGSVNGVRSQQRKDEGEGGLNTSDGGVDASDEGR